MQPRNIHKEVGKKFLILCAGMALFFFVCYSVMWFAIVGAAQSYLDTAWPSLQRELLYTVSGERPVIHGYPDLPQFDYAGTLVSPEGAKIEIPALHVRGLPYRNQVQYLHFAKGLTFSAPFMERIISIDEADIQARVPMAIPLSSSPDDLKKWQAQNTPVRIEYISIKSLGMVMEGYGEIGLDEDLQLKGFLRARIDGLTDLLAKIKNNSPKNSKDIDMAMALVNSMSQLDEKTGKTYFNTVLRIEKGGAFIGPLKVLPLPYLSWGRAAEVPHRIKRDEKP